MFEKWTVYWMKMIKAVKCFFIAICDAINHDGIEHAGYLSFLLMMSIFPSLVLFVYVVGLFDSSYGLSEMMLDFILNSSWAVFIDALKPRIVEITSAPPHGIVSIVLISAIWTSSSIFEGLRTILNRSYRVNTPPTYLFRRFVSLVEFMAVLVLVVLTMLLFVVLPGFVKLLALSGLTKMINPQMEMIRYVFLIVVFFSIISMIYYFLPNRRQKLVYTFPGTALVLGFSYLFSYLFKIYLHTVPSINIIYGSIAGVIIALLYFYFCSLIFIIGGEFNYQCEQIIFRRKNNN